MVSVERWSGKHRVSLGEHGFCSVPGSPSFFLSHSIKDDLPQTDVIPVRNQVIFWWFWYLIFSYNETQECSNTNPKHNNASLWNSRGQYTLKAVQSVVCMLINPPTGLSGKLSHSQWCSISSPLSPKSVCSWLLNAKPETVMRTVSVTERKVRRGLLEIE